ncbi:MAG: efflux transporter outer membrane subunit, partial [Deltaproteobacteria bacterium]|nr:efflux transporter outer membrane subunit [Deltaproteobacteria bacterium]
MLHQLTRLGLGFACLALLSGCVLRPQPEVRGAAAVALPSGFSLYSDAEPSSTPWWHSFNSPELDSLVTLALQSDFTIVQAQARLEQARYTALKAGAYQFPEILHTATGEQQKSEAKDSPALSGDEWSMGLSLSYEIDLWGRVRALKESEKENFQASRADLQTAVLGVSGELTEIWLELIENRCHEDLFERQLELQRQLLQLITLRFPLARATALDIYQQRQIVEKLEAALIPTRKNQFVLRRGLALLAGREQLAEALVGARDFPRIDSLPALGLPADLLAARPDVRAAGLRLKSTDWELVAARAERLPALRLTSSGRYFAEVPADLFDNWIANLAGSLSAPLLDGGRRRAEIGRIRALADERLAAYRQIVIKAFHEVEDALVREDEASATLASLRRQLELSRQTLREARRRYLN